VTAELGRENLEALLSIGGSKIQDADKAARLRQIGRKLALQGMLIGAVLTAIALLIP
jgi:hypothetical protein